MPSRLSGRYHRQQANLERPHSQCHQDGQQHPILSANIRETCYKTFARPSVEYASCVWDTPTAENISVVNMVQQRAARFVIGEYRCTSSVSALIKTLGWHSLAHRRAMSRVTMLYRVTDGLTSLKTILHR